MDFHKRVHMCLRSFGVECRFISFKIACQHSSCSSMSVENRSFFVRPPSTSGLCRRVSSGLRRKKIPIFERASLMLLLAHIKAIYMTESWRNVDSFHEVPSIFLALRKRKEKMKEKSDDFRFELDYLGNERVER